MRAVLEHVGIAVRDIGEALAFYRDALGLDVHVPEEVAEQGVRAHMVPVGGAALELLEGTTPASAITRFVERRGPGLHHVTLRVDDIEAVVDRLKARGVRLIDETPRTGAGGSRVVFVHPSSAHGVLVEFVQHPEEGDADKVRLTPGAATGATPATRAAEPGAALAVKSLDWGDLRLTTLHDGPFRLDGGAMFGIVPRVLWERRMPADDRHRIQLAMRPLLVEGAWGRMLVDCGAGDKMDAKRVDIYGLDRSRALDSALADAGLNAGSIDIVLATHLHFDHFGGATKREGGRLQPRFPNARCAIRAAEWEDATHPHERNRASYLQDDFVPLREAGVVDFYENDGEIRPGVHVVRTGGHTGQHQIVFITSGGRTAVFTADLIPTTAHLQDAWIMGYDLFPVDTLMYKKRFIREAIDRSYLIFFEHDPHVAAGYIRETKDGKRYVEQVL